MKNRWSSSYKLNIYISSETSIEHPCMFEICPIKKFNNIKEIKESIKEEIAKVEEQDYIIDKITIQLIDTCYHSSGILLPIKKEIFYYYSLEDFLENN